jgi:hypothetical protein
MSYSLWLYSHLLYLGSFSVSTRTVGRTPWMKYQIVARLLPIHRTTQTQNKRTQTSMPLVRFKPATPVFKRMKTVHALDSAATVIDDLLM